jgi:hypothetical protein
MDRDNDELYVVTTPLKITIIGSHQYLDRMLKYKEELEKEGHEVRLPALDSHPDWDELQVCVYNRELIRWANRIDIIWDQRSVGTVFDFGMVFMAQKPIRIVYMEPKTFRGVMEKYEAKMREGGRGGGRRNENR